MAHSAHDSDSIYQLAPAFAELAIVDWDGVYAVYQRTSGETHVFNEVTVSFLRCLREGSGSLAMIVNRVAIAFGAAEDEIFAADFVDVAARLEELGLIEQAHSGISDT